MEWVKITAPLAANIILVMILVYYRLNRRFKKDRKGIGPFLDHNLVEVIIGAVVIPDFAGLVTKLL